MDRLEHYLDQVCRGISGPRSLRQHIRQELREHLQDATAEHPEGRGCRSRKPLEPRASEDFPGAGAGALGAGGDARAPAIDVGGRSGHAVEGEDLESEMALDVVVLSRRGRRDRAGGVVAALRHVVYRAEVSADHAGRIGRSLDPRRGRSVVDARVPGGLGRVQLQHTTILVFLIAGVWGLFRVARPCVRTSRSCGSRRWTAACGLMVVILLTCGIAAGSCYRLGMPAQARSHLAGALVEQIACLSTSSVVALEHWHEPGLGGGGTQQANLASQAIDRLAGAGPAVYSLSSRRPISGQ